MIMKKNDLYYNNLIKHFKNIDITFNKAYLIDNRVAKDLAKDYILKSNIIFLMGGDAKKQIDSVKEYDLFEILKSKRRNNTWSKCRLYESILSCGI